MISAKDLKKENSMDVLVANYIKVYLYALEKKIKNDAAKGYNYTTIYTSSVCTSDIRDGKSCFPKMDYIYDYANELNINLCCNDDVIAKAKIKLKKELEDAGYKIKNNLLLMGTPGLNADYGYKITW